MRANPPAHDAAAIAEIAALIERLEKRAQEDRDCADNSRVVAELLEPQMVMFNLREEKRWNTYAVRMAVDHRNSIKRDTRYADDLDAAISFVRASLAQSKGEE